MNKIRSFVTGDGMRARAIRGTLMSVAGFGGGQFIRLASNLILTRILFPEAFGLMALVQVFLTGLDNFSDMGVRPAIIQSKRGDDPDFLNTAWTMQIMRGVILWGLACALALPVAQFYGQEALLQIIPILGFTTVIGGFRSTRMPLANRHLKLGRLTLVELYSQIVGTVVMILAALWLQSVWALVIGSIAGVLLKTVLSHVMLPGPANRLRWDPGAFWEIFHFGKYIFVSTIAGYLISQGDRLVLGKFVSLEELALYSIAFFLATVPAMLNVRLSSRVLFPLYRSHPPLESDTNRRHIGKARGLLVLLFLGMIAVLAGGGELIIRLLYDDRYLASGPIMVLLALSITPSLIVEGYKNILLANGNSRDYTIMTVGIAIARVTVLVLLVRNFGLVGAIATPLLVDIATYPLIVRYIRRYGGWYPAQDAGFALLALALGAGALWLNPGARALVAPLAGVLLPGL